MERPPDHQLELFRLTSFSTSRKPRKSSQPAASDGRTLAERPIARSLFRAPLADPFSERELTDRARQKALKLGLPKLAALVHVRWNGRLRTTAGRAIYTPGTIELHPGLKSISAEEVERTLLHELAHLVAHARCGRRRIEAHGPEWRQACVDLGIAGEDRCHNLPFLRRKIRRKLAYTCPACGAVIYRVRRFKRSVACYECCRNHNRGLYHPKFRLMLRYLDRTEAQQADEGGE